MRIVGGLLKGRRIEAAPGGHVRPTPDRVREAVFNILGQDLEGFHFLDLFAGTGAMGLEAASRKAERVVLVERDPLACAVILGNAEALGIGDRVRLERRDSIEILGSLGRGGERFDAVFADPPYTDPPDRLDALVRGLAARSILAPGGTFLLQVKRGTRPPTSPALEMRPVRRYGLTWILQYDPGEHDEGPGVDGPP